MVQVKFLRENETGSAKIGFAVIVAKHDGKWILCRHRDRTTWEIPEYHVESGETPDDAAIRKLYEETGAKQADLAFVSGYSVTSEGNETFGNLYYAEVKSFDSIPSNSEIEEIAEFKMLPKNLTYPEIQPILFTKVQVWINQQNSADEMWDVYDSVGNPTGRLHRRGDPLPEGDYHLAVHVWMRNSKGEFLLTQRSKEKGFPYFWETTGGSAVVGDDSLSAALREVREEVGLNLDPSSGKIWKRWSGLDFICDVWIFTQDFSIDDVVLLPGETCNAMYADIAKIKELVEEGVFFPYAYIDEFIEKMK